MNERTHTVTVGNVTRHLPLIKIEDGLHVALFDITGDTELVEAAAVELLRLIPEGTEVLVAPEGKSLTLLHVLGVASGLPTVVLRKKDKYLRKPIRSEALRSITTAGEQRLYLGAAEAEKVRGRHCLFVDDVISRGETMKASLLLLNEASKIDVMAILTEGDRPWATVISLGHLPLFHD